MQDAEIIDLYWKREESAITHTKDKYDRYLMKIAYNVLSDWNDSEESVNDTYWKAWNSMPPKKPDRLSIYLGSITRRTAIDIYRKCHRQKRVSSNYTISLEELSECIQTDSSPEEYVNSGFLADEISAFLKTLSPEKRTIFVGRYYFLDSISELAAYYGMSEAKVKTMLHRTRNGLKQHLQKEGYVI